MAEKNGCCCYYSYHHFCHTLSPFCSLCCSNSSVIVLGKENIEEMMIIDNKNISILNTSIRSGNNNNCSNRFYFNHRYLTVVAVTITTKTIKTAALSSQKSKVAQSNTLSDNDVSAAFRITFMVLPLGMIEYSNIFHNYIDDDIKKIAHLTTSSMHY